MKRFLFAIALSVAGISSAFAADIGVTISIGHPDFFGRIELGNVAPPPVIYARPVIIERAPHPVHVEPIYLRVPPDHAKNWKLYCARYDACGHPVYFVKDEWYRNEYAPRYREEHWNHRWEEQRREEIREEVRREERHEEHHDRRYDAHDEHHHDDGDHRDHEHH